MTEIEEEGRAHAASYIYATDAARAARAARIASYTADDAATAYAMRYPRGAKPFVIWFHQGYQQWTPERFATEDAMLQRVAEGTFGEFIVTREMQLRVIDRPAAPTADAT